MFLSNVIPFITFSEHLLSPLSFAPQPTINLPTYFWPWMTFSVICQMISFVCFIHTLLWKCQNMVMGDGGWDITLHSISSPAERDNSCSPLISPSFSICWFPQCLSAAPDYFLREKGRRAYYCRSFLLCSSMIDP